MNALEIRHHLQTLADEDKALVLQRFFKTGPGEYGEGDVFLGIRVPQLRKLAKTHQALALPEITTLLRSPIHEERLLALLILVRAYSRGDMSRQEEIYRLYLEHTAFINNWDLVDASAEHIVGAHLKDRSKEPLYRLARSPLLWERRIAIMATFHYIKEDDYAETLRVAATLLRDREDLIHKAVGWMLREVGKRDVLVEEAFLKEHYRTMPRTMLRYAIERFPEERRQRYLKGEM
jgi:3-methyladenine DNA glycosylase AlkD